MPGYIVKANRDEDWYVNWSTIVDPPTCWGSRAYMIGLLRGQEADPARFDRADLLGTSARWENWPDSDQPYGWNDDQFILGEAGPRRDGGYYLLPRSNLLTFCERGCGEDTVDLLVFQAYDDETG